MKNSNKGITLIALVITIIVLLILAGVSIAMISGNNGILAKTGEAITKQQLGTAQDKCVLIASDTLANYYYDIYVNTTSGSQYQSAALDNQIVNAIVNNDANKKELKDLGVEPSTMDAEGSLKTFTLTYTDGSKIDGKVDNGKVTWSGYTFKGNTTTPTEP